MSDLSAHLPSRKFVPLLAESRHLSARAIVGALMVVLFAMRFRQCHDADSARLRQQGLVATAVEIRVADTGSECHDQKDREKRPGGKRLTRLEGMIAWLVEHCLTSAHTLEKPVTVHPCTTH